MEENIGKRLRRAREGSGLTVDDAVYRAKLPRDVVEALENGDFGYFASPLYARSFLKQYGEYVGVDVAPWIDDLVPTPLIDREAVEAFMEIVKPVPAAVPKERKKETGGGNAMSAMWLIVISGSLVWGGLEFYRMFERKHSEAPAATATATATEAEPVTAEEESKEEEHTAANDGPEPPRRAIIVREE